MATSATPSLPAHVAIIMDGNGRWAAQHGRTRAWGHKRGVDSVRRVLEASGELGIRYLTLYAFSDENWSRPAGEVRGLLGLLDHFVRSEADALRQKNVRLRLIGDLNRLGPPRSARLKRLVSDLAGNDGLQLTLAVSYGGRREICRAVQRFAQACGAEEMLALRLADLQPETLSEFLDTGDLPDPDLLIRTSGEYRVSNFLLWQLAYTEFVFSDVLWPDFDRPHLEAALREYAARQRRFGGVTMACPKE